ncbi:MAG: D-tyrosyl-tRNA(Tyr) deacylase [Phycisphaerales bacterium]|nr:D-tyrosyl-tRNA(Tyr) deacylase [Phycisphaerales bacterium]
MRAVTQRVSRAAVRVDGDVVGAINAGLLVYAAAIPDDTIADADFIADKIANLRIFKDDAGKMNRSVLDAGGGVLVVSAFTVAADARRGRRPSFDSSASGDVARPLIDALIDRLRELGAPVETGRFAAEMFVESVNDGPICVLLDSRRVF